MEGAENSLPPSKKRAAERELTRDTPIDDAEDTPEHETETFKKASDEVLATRRIVKVCRQQTSSAPSSNPFAGICLVTPKESCANPSEASTEEKSASESTLPYDTKGSDSVTKDSEKAKEGEIEQLQTKTSEVVVKSSANNDAVVESTVKEYTTEKESSIEKSEADKEKIKDDNVNKNENKSEADKESASEVDKEKTEHDNDTEYNDEKENSNKEGTKADKVENEERSVEGGPLNSFQQLSSSQNAFTGLAGSGFSSSSFSFGSISNDGLGSGSASIFGMKNDKPFGLGLSNNGSSLFGVSESSAASKSEGSGLSTMQEVVVETGEENERVVFSADSILFEFVDGSWKERGKGELKINVVTIGSEKARLLMRSRGIYRLILNARLYPDMKLTNMDKKGVTFACINSATEGKVGLSTFALKFKDGSIVEDFKAAIIAHKGVKTGEENERVVFSADSVLFEFVDGSWKERGKGELKINVATNGSEKARLLMRSTGNYRLILNARLYPDMKLTNMDKKGVTFACINSATEGKVGLSIFALKFKDGSIVEDFKAAIIAHKGEASRGLKTPENSP